MKARLAAYEDIPKLIDYISAFHAQSPWSEFQFSTAVTRKYLQAMIGANNSCILIHDHGAFGGSLVPLKFGSGHVAQEVFWWAEKDGLTLLRAFEKWSEDQGATAICMAALPSSRVEPIYARRGYKPTEYYHMKAL